MLSVGPTADGVKALRARIQSLLDAGVSPASIARDIGVGDRVFRQFLDTPKQRPAPKTWDLYRAWYAKQEGKSASAVREQPPIYQVRPQLDAMEDAEKEEREVLVKLSAIYGRMESMTEQIESLLTQHKRIASRFAPWVQREASAAFGDLLERVRTGDPAAEETARRFAKEHAQTQAKDTESSHRDKGAAGRRTTFPQGGQDA